MKTSRVKEEKGIALVLVLVLSAAALAMMAGLIYMMTSGTQLSGVQKRYATALEAARGGAQNFDDLIQKVQESDFDLLTLQTETPGITYVISDLCLLDKFTKQTVDWDPSCSTSVLSDASYDYKLSLGVDPVYTVFGKVYGSMEGNTSDAGLYEKGGVTSAQKDASEIDMAPVPRLYAVQFMAINETNPQEKAVLDVLYMY